MIRYSVLNLPPLPPPPSPNMGCGGGDKKCRKSKESPPWVCEKCAKKSRDEKNRNGGRLMGHEIGCGYEAPDETTESTLDLGRNELSCPVCKAKVAKKNPDELGCMERPPGAPDETREATLDLGGHEMGCPNAGTASVEAEGELGCDKCQKGKKRRQAAKKNFEDSFPSGWLNLQGPMLRQVPLRGMGNGGRGGRSTAWGNDEEDEEYPYGMYGRQPNGMLGQVRLVGMGDGGRGGRSVPYDESFREGYGEYRYCDPSMELCPTPLVGPVGIGDGGRGGRSVPYDESFREPFEGYRYCDPSMELCPTPLVGPVGVGIGGRRCNGRHGYLGQGGQAYGCPASAPTLDPTLNCQRDARGNAVCSNGMYFPPGCPHTPPEQYFSPGIAPDEVHNGILEAKVPAPRAAGSTGAEGVGGASSSTTNVLPLAAGGIAALGLLYAIFR